MLIETFENIPGEDRRIDVWWLSDATSRRIVKERPPSWMRSKGSYWKPIQRFYLFTDSEKRYSRPLNTPCNTFFGSFLKQIGNDLPAGVVRAICPGTAEGDTCGRALAGGLCDVRTGYNSDSPPYQ